MLQVQQHTCLNKLFDALSNDLAALFASNSLGVFDTPNVLVQSPAMEKWLQVKLAKRQGVLANVAFPMPASFIWQLYGDILGVENIAERNTFRKEAISWRMMRLLEEQPNDIPSKVHELLTKADKTQSSEQTKAFTFQFCQRMGDLFDQYLVYRPHWVREWEQSNTPDELHWQGQLWRGLVAHDKNPQRAAHRANYNAQSIKQLTQSLPEGVANTPLFIFALSSMPPQYLALLQALAQHIDITLYLQLPSLEYFSDNQARKKQAWLLSHHTQEKISAAQVDDLHLDEGNPLLASMGGPIQDFHQQLSSVDAIDYADAEPIDLEDAKTVLDYTQCEVKNLSFAGDFDNWLSRDITPSYTLAEQDDSLLIHSCHSPLRELQVLKNQLLSFFAQDKKLKPEDILVITPKPDVYAPFLANVFKQQDSQQIDYAIAEAKRYADAPLMLALFDLLKLEQNRFSAPEVLDLLEQAPVHKQWHFSSSEREQVRLWVKHEHVHWGWNAQQKRDLDLPANQKFTWQQGMHQSMLGLLMEQDANFSNLVSSQNSSEQQQLYARWFECLRNVQQCIADFNDAKTIDEWIIFFDEIFNQLLCETSPQDSRAKQQLYTCLDEIKATLAYEEFSPAISKDIILSLIRDALQSSQQSFQLISGKMNITSMLPMRGIPFKVICMLGMNDGDYPFVESPLEFDLMHERKRELGDRSRRDEDAYQFLQALLSAKEKLHISFIGKNIQDNKNLNPSSFVRELLFYLEQVCAYKPAADDKSSKLPLLIEHPLNSFSERYFDKPPEHLNNFNELDYAAAQNTQQKDYHWYDVAFTEKSNTTEQPFVEININQLIRLFKNTERDFTQQIGVKLDPLNIFIDDHENLSLKPWTKQDYLDSAWQAQQENINEDTWLTTMHNMRELPVEFIGKKILKDIWLLAKEQRGQIADTLQLPQQQVSININLSDIKTPATITGACEVYANNQQQFVVFASSTKILANKHRLAPYLQHLCLNAMGITTSSLLLSGDNKLQTIQPLAADQAKNYLSHFAAAWIDSQNQYLPFDIEAGSNYVKNPDIVAFINSQLCFNDELHAALFAKLSTQLIGTMDEVLSKKASKEAQ